MIRGAVNSVFHYATFIHEKYVAKSNLPMSTIILLTRQEVYYSQSCLNVFNTFFTNVGKNLAVKFKYVCTSIKQDRNVVENSLKFNSVTPNNVCKQIQSLCSAKATGSDKISARLLKTAAPQISDSLCYVINLSLKSGAVPKEWNHARVIPLYKDGKCDEASNYRPIAVLPIISKIMERIVHDQLYKFIEENNILNKWQSGFRPGYSTETAMTYVTDLLLTEMDSKKLTVVVFLDLKKAFDTVDHALLLTKLRNYGIRGDEHSWFTSYLRDRTQSVSLENVTSDSMDISYGVPQGSILGPLLFTLYINDLPSVTKTCKVILYADDTAIIYSDKQKEQIEKHLNDDMAIVKTWLDENKLTLNVKKTKSMLIGNKKLLNEAEHLDIRLDMDLIEQVGEFKYLGVWLDSSLKFTCHISKMSSKISSAIGVISRVSRYLPVVQRKMLYNAMVLPYFNYCSITWATADQKHLDVLERLQKRAGRMVLGVPSRTSTRDVYDKLKWTNLRTKWKINRCLMVHKCLNSNVPEYLCNHFTRSDHKHSTRTSTSGSVNIPALRTVQGQRSFGYTGSKDFNSLPVNLKSIKEFKYFKRETKEHFRNLWCNEY